MAIIKKTKDNKRLQGCREMRTVVHCWWECKLVQSLQKTVWRSCKKLKIQLPCDPAVSLLGIYLKKMKSLSQRDTCTPVFIGALFTIGKTYRQPKCPLMAKENVVYIFKEMLSSHDKERNPIICDNLDKP